MKDRESTRRKFRVKCFACELQSSIGRGRGLLPDFRKIRLEYQGSVNIILLQSKRIVFSFFFLFLKEDARDLTNCLERLNVEK